jgi:hypothetical protein
MQNRYRRSLLMVTVGVGVAVGIATQALAQFIQQGPKLVGAGAVVPAAQGESVALSADGNTAIVGGYTDNSGTGAAWIYTRSGGVWTQQGSKLVGTGAEKASQGSLFDCLVDFGAGENVPVVYVVPSPRVAEARELSHRTWLLTLGKKGQEHKDSQIRRLSQTTRASLVRQTIPTRKDGSISIEMPGNS